MAQGHPVPVPLSRHTLPGGKLVLAAGNVYFNLKFLV